MLRGEVWWAETPGGDRPVIVLTRDPVADRIAAVVVVACTRTVRGLQTELHLGLEDGLPEPCVANFDNLHTLRRQAFRERITSLTPTKLHDACRTLDLALGCV